MLPIAKDATGPVVGQDGTIYLGGGTAGLVAVTPVGKVAWRAKLQGAVLGAPAILADGTVVVGTTGKKLVAFLEGKKRWTFGAPNKVTCNLTVSGTTVYATTKGASLVAVGVDGKRRWQAKLDQWAYHSNSQPAVDGARRVFARGFAFNASGKPLWRVKQGDAIATADGFACPAGRTGVVWLDAATGKVRATVKVKAEIRSLAQGPSRTIYASSEGADAAVHACTRSKVIRRFQANNWIRTQALVDAAENLYFACVGGVYAYAKTGRLLWSAPIKGDVYASPAIGADGTIYLTTSAGALYAFR